MEVRTSPTGKKLFHPDQKRAIVEEFKSGISATKLARKYETSPQNIYKWSRLASSKEQQPELFDKLQRAYGEIERLKQCLGEILVNRLLESDSGSKHRITN